MATEKFTFLDQQGVKILSTNILTKVNTKVAERIVQEISDASDHDHVASAKLLNSLLKTRDELIAANKTSIDSNTTSIANINIEGLTKKVDDNTASIEALNTGITDLDTLVDSYTHLTVNVVTGPINEVADPSIEVLYFQRDDEADTTWMLYIYREDGTWVNIGDTGVDLSGYWSKDDNAELAELLNVPVVTPMSDDEITAAIEAAFNDTDILTPPPTPVPTTDFTVTADNRAMVGYTDTTEELVIPATFTGDDGKTYKVVAIGDSAFRNTSLKSITIPEGITSIGYEAFYKCASLSSVTIPESVTSIGHAAFNGCTSLISVTIPKGVIIGNFVFCDCTSLTSVIIPEGVSIIGLGAFGNCTSLTSITIPDSVTSISDAAFQGCTSLSSVTLPNTLTTIKSGAFDSCTSLTSITIPNSVTNIGEEAFYCCDNLSTINIDNTVDAISGSPWGADESLSDKSITTVNWLRTPKDFTDFTITTENRSMVGYTGAANEELNIPATFTGDDGVEYKVVAIGDNAFNICVSLSSVIIPEGVTSIGKYAFVECDTLRSVTIPNSVISIKDAAFAGCTSLTTINIDNTTDAISGAPWYATNATVNWLRS